MKLSLHTINKKYIKEKSEEYSFSGFIPTNKQTNKPTNKTSKYDYL